MSATVILITVSTESRRPAAFEAPGEMRDLGSLRSHPYGGAVRRYGNTQIYANTRSISAKASR